MRAATIKELKQELEHQPQATLFDLCLRLAKFKKENKELLTYLLFEAGNEQGYIESVKSEIDDQFLELNIKNLYIAKKNLRKILRAIGRYSKYSGDKSTEAALLLYFCKKLQGSGLNIEKSTALVKLYASQLKKIRSAIDTLHEDLQYDLRKELAQVE